MESLPNMCYSVALNSEFVGAVDTLKRKSEDIGWEYGEIVDTAANNKVRCKLCKQEIFGGINRL